MLVVSACTLESSKNGYLDGAWRLVRINGEVPAQTMLYWNFQGKMLVLDDLMDGKGRFILRFEHSDGILSLSQPYIYDRENGDKELKDSTLLRPYGINDLNMPFAIDIKGKGESMTLKTTDTVLELRNL